MPRVLVADDNSQIHRAISLALKDTGIEVVAVGNGEAAVRKLPELKPDLVLADIFMPVRSGYELCEFVKNDPRFADIPVVLLIGAFDPFDEREAQRVKADAVLKKPFMPTDALVRTVTELIRKSAAKPVSVPAAEKTPQPRAEAAKPAAEPSPEFSDAAPEEFSMPRAPLSFQPNEQTLAFGSLLETPAENNEAVVTSQRDPSLGEPAFWAPAENDSPLVEDVEPTAEKSEEPEIGDEEISEEWQLNQLLEPFPGDAQGMPAIESVAAETEALPELPSFSEPVGHVVVAVEVVPESSAIEALMIPENALPELFAEPVQPEMVPALPQAEMTPAEPVFASVAVDQIEESQHLLAELNVSSSWPLPTIAEPEPVEQQVLAVEPIQAPHEEAPAFATLAPFLATLAHSAAHGIQQISEPEVELLPTLTAEMTESPVAMIEPAQSSANLEASPAVALAVPATAQADPLMVETLVQRVIERMQPRMLDLVTRELLRPVVEALVRKELDPK